ncbi:MAG TPA: PAS domain-containing sensor histidine kinase [Beijerinckiaceae bacterium]|nr:PAS domain-containing sensor histidine kinase [Beijerinckiaceae bacterium]
MSFASSLNARIEALIHESARSDPVEKWRHETLIAARLFAALAIAGLSPFCLAFAGRPGPGLAVACALAIAPLTSVAVLSRTGRIAWAQAVTAASFLACALFLLIAEGSLSAPAFGWLILAPIEGAIALDGVLTLCAGTAALLILALAVLGISGAAAAPLAAPWELAGLAAPSLLYAVWAALWGLRQQAFRDRLERVGAARMDSLSEAMGDLVLRHDRSGAVLSASGDSKALFGLATRELMGRGFFERVHVADRPRFLTVIADAAESTRTVTATLRLRVSSVESVHQGFEEPVFAWVEVRARQLIAASADLEAASVLAIVRDVSEHKARERQVEEARLEAERAAAWKDRFLANVSHELRTPLNAIIGFSEMLSTEDLLPGDPAKSMEYAQIIHSSGQHLLAVVNSILDMSKIEAGRFDILPEPFDLTQLVDSCCDMVSLKAREGAVQIVRACSAALPELVADKRACKQILLNLLSNAVKFTPSGGRVTIEAHVEGASIVIGVADTGIGVGARDLPRLGDAFFQARSSYDRPYDGTGLGLSVVRGLVGLHGGVIAIESAPGEGTCVTVRLPADCRSARFSSAPAKIEAIAKICKPATEPVTNQTVQMVKKIA